MMHSNNFILFSGEIYYAEGGANDNIKMFDTLEQALKAAGPPEAGGEWWHVFDTSKRTIVAQSESRAYNPMFL